MEQHISHLDSERFGFPVARINEFQKPVLLVLERFQGLGVRLVISRVPADQIQLLNEMEQAGFRLKDIQVTYNYDLQRPLPRAAKDGYSYRAFRSNDREDIEAIAAQAFQDYGHYSKLDVLSEVKTGDIYADWARRCCLEPAMAEQIIVADTGTEVAGFLAFRTQEEEDGPRYTAGVMGAVGARHRRTGVFQNINILGLHWAQEQGFLRVEHNVLITNPAVNKTYTSLGFHLIRSEVTMHCLLV